MFKKILYFLSVFSLIQAEDSKLTKMRKKYVGETKEEMEEKKKEKRKEMRNYTLVAGVFVVGSYFLGRFFSGVEEDDMKEPTPSTPVLGGKKESLEFIEMSPLSRGDSNISLRITPPVDEGKEENESQVSELTEDALKIFDAEVGRRDSVASVGLVQSESSLLGVSKQEDDEMDFLAVEEDSYETDSALSDVSASELSSALRSVGSRKRGVRKSKKKGKV